MWFGCEISLILAWWCLIYKQPGSFILFPQTQSRICKNNRIKNFITIFIIDQASTGPPGHWSEGIVKESFTPLSISNIFSLRIHIFYTKFWGWLLINRQIAQDIYAYYLKKMKNLRRNLKGWKSTRKCLQMIEGEICAPAKETVFLNK